MRNEKNNDGDDEWKNERHVKLRFYSAKPAAKSSKIPKNKSFKFSLVKKFCKRGPLKQ